MPRYDDYDVPGPEDERRFDRDDELYGRSDVDRIAPPGYGPEYAEEPYEDGYGPRRYIYRSPPAGAAVDLPDGY